MKGIEALVDSLCHGIESLRLKDEQMLWQAILKERKMTGIEAHNLMMCDNKVVRKENSLFKIENDRLYMRDFGTDDWKLLEHIGDIYGFYLTDGYEVYEETLKFDVGKLYKTRAGYKAKIYSVENNLFGNIHGAILIPEYNLWEAHEWSSNGWMYHPEKAPEDLVSEWTEPEESHGQPTWESENKPVVKDGFWEKYQNAKCIAMDFPDDWHYFDRADIHYNKALLYWPGKTCGSKMTLNPEDYPVYTGKPEDSLLIRPEGV
jgi:hypothetical protein